MFQQKHNTICEPETLHHNFLSGKLCAHQKSETNWIWPDSARSGQIRDGSRRIRLDQAGSGFDPASQIRRNPARIRPDLAGAKRIRPDVAGYERIRLDPPGSNGFGPGLNFHVLS